MSTRSAEPRVPTPALSAGWREKNASIVYVVPFATFLLFLALSSLVPADARWEPPLWLGILAGVCVICWPRELSLRPRHWAASIIIGAAAFVLWISPDLLFPNYRQMLPFSNGIVGHLHSSMQAAQVHSAWSLAWRTARAVIIVPVVEELFWRAWLMRWLIDIDFRKVPLGAYTPLAFWMTAVLFASEHGPYWDVGLLTGIIYNFWMIRSKSVADCILMHAVTNAALSAYVIATAQWQYWQ